VSGHLSQDYTPAGLQGDQPLLLHMPALTSCGCGDAAADVAAWRPWELLLLAQVA
jgi:hypothetical protein